MRTTWGRTEVEGTLWLDADAAALRRLEYRYVNQPWAAGARPASGELGFERLENGAWIVRDWTIRAPREVTRRRDGAGQTVSVMHETTGRVIEVTGLSHRAAIPFERPVAEVSGRVLSHDGHLPLGNVLVYLSGTSHADTTGVDGAFRLVDVPPGTYELVWDHPELRPPNRAAAVTLMTVASQRDTTVLLRAPYSAASLLGCDEPGGVIYGGVEEPRTGTPLNGVLVRIVDGHGGTREAHSGAGGRFRLCGVPAGGYTLTAQLLDMVGPDVATDVADGGAAHVTVPVPLSARNADDRAPIELDPLTVRVRRHEDRLADLEYRMERGSGSFIVRDDIRRSNPTRLRDMLRTYGMVSTQGPTPWSVLLAGRRHRCAPMVYIDGHRVTSGIDPDGIAAMVEAGRAVDLVHPVDVEAVEIYVGPASVPGEFGGSTARCGVVVIWTRLMR